MAKHTDLTHLYKMWKLFVGLHSHQASTLINKFKYIGRQKTLQAYHWLSSSIQQEVRKDKELELNMKQNS